MELRPYQQSAINAAYQHLRDHDTNPCVVIPTAGGKTPVMATMCRDAVQLWGGRVLVLAHVKELLEQTAEKLRAVAPDLHCGIYSAGLGSRNTLAPVIVAGVQSAYRRGGELGHFDLVLVDEAHMIPADGDGMYRTLLTDLKRINRNLRVIGFTATPFRLSSGPICTPDGILNTICYEVGVRELIVQGYLCPLVTKAGRQKAAIEKLHVRGGEFISNEVEALMNEDALVESACNEILEQTRDRRSVLIFASGIAHGEHIRQTFERLGAGCRSVFGDTLEFDRAQILSDFKSGKVKYLVNVNVLTTGFDAPNIDCVAMLRPTLSPGLWYQVCGRGFRIHPAKKNCLILDFGGNAVRHGPVDALKIKNLSRDRESGDAPAKECPTCSAVIATGYAICPHCGHTFARAKSKHESAASSNGVLKGQTSVETYPVSEVTYAVHVKRNAPENAPRSMRVDYRIGLNRWQSEWICIEHAGFARQKAESWWLRRSHEPIPDNADDAVVLAQSGVLTRTKSITIKSVAGDDFNRITAYELDGAPIDSTLPIVEPDYIPANDEIPF